MTITRIFAMTTLVTFDNRSDIPFYKQIYDGYRAAILSGRMRPGERLPSTRALAAELNISRLPVVNAFEQLLHEGYIEGRAGSGTYVKDSIPDELARPVAMLAQKAAAPLRPVPPRLGPFRVSLPALDRFPLRVWSRLGSKDAKELTMEQMAYGDAAGYRTV